MSARHSDTGFTLIELLMVVTIIVVVAAVAVPGLLRARMAGDEASAMGSLRAIISGQSTYAVACGAGGYAQVLEDLAKAPAGARAGFVSPDLSTTPSVKSGFVVSLAADSGAFAVASSTHTCNGATNDAVSSYFAEAHPVTAGATGQRSFATDARGGIYVDLTGAPIPPGMAGAAPLQ